LTTIGDRLLNEGEALAMKWRLGERDHQTTGWSLMKAGLLTPLEVAQSGDFGYISVLELHELGKMSSEDVQRFLDRFDDKMLIEICKRSPSSLRPEHYLNLVQHKSADVRAAAREAGNLKKSDASPRAGILHMRSIDYAMQEHLKAHPQLLDDPKVRAHIARTFARTLTPSAKHYTLADIVTLRELAAQEAGRESWGPAAAAVERVDPTFLDAPLKNACEAINTRFLDLYPNGAWQDIAAAWPDSILGRLQEANFGFGDFSHGNAVMLRAQFDAMAAHAKPIFHFVKEVKDLPADLVDGFTFLAPEILSSVGNLR
jgi:hypothetical protein